MSGYEAGGRALYLTEHPHVTQETWALLDQPTRDYWARRAHPVTDAVRRSLMTEAEIAIRNALHELDVQRGNGVFNLPVLRRILESGLTVESVRTVRRPAAQGADLLGLDDIDGR